MPKSKAMTLKQQRFADEYLKSGNAAEAARLAGYSARVCRTAGYENLQKPQIQAYIARRLKEMEEESYLTLNEALKITASIARGEPRRIKQTRVNEMGEPEDIEIVDYPTFKDRQAALEHFYKISGQFRDRVEMEVTQTNTILESLLNEIKS